MTTVSNAGQRADDDEKLDFEARLRGALDIANVPSLLMVLFQLTGDLKWLEEPYRPTQGKGVSDHDTGGLPDAVQAEIREAAADAISAWNAGRPVAIPEPDEALALRMLGVAMGETMPEDYGPLLMDEIGGGGADLAAARIREIGVPDGFSAVVVGAGVSGILAGVRLAEAGIPYVVFEKEDTVGGTWNRNRYPGSGVDSPNHLYSYSFAPQHDWHRYFEARGEIHNYLERVSREFGVRKNIRFQTEVLSAEYDETTLQWTVTVKQANGDVETVTANVVFSAVGIFNPPHIPEIPGLDNFAGTSLHSSVWPEGLSVRGKRVGIIGTGATAMQLVPAIADEVDQLVVFQRDPQWALPFEKCRLDVPEPIRWLLQEVPLYQQWYRARLGWTFNDTIFPTLIIDPEWPHPEKSLNRINERHREFLTSYIQTELGDRQDLLDKVLPSYPPYSKRILLDSGWYRAVSKPNVTIETSPIEEIVPTGVRCADLIEHDIDILVFATGFEVTTYLSAFDVVGSRGKSLRDAWDDDDAQAYIMGTTVPGFPNFFCMYGPNSQPATGGSIVFTLESQVHYALGLIAKMLESDVGAIECRQDVCDEYNRVVEDRLNSMVWSHRGTRSYYRNDRGRVTVICPFRYTEIRRMVNDAKLSDYILTPRVGANADGGNN